MNRVMTNNKITTAILALALIFVLFSRGQKYISVSTTIREINKYGNIELEYTATEFLEAGFAYGDIITVIFRKLNTKCQ